MKADGVDLGSSFSVQVRQVVYSGRDDEVHQHGVAIMLNKDAAKALIN